MERAAMPANRATWRMIADGNNDSEKGRLSHGTGRLILVFVARLEGEVQ